LCEAREFPTNQEGKVKEGVGKRASAVENTSIRPAHSLHMVLKRENKRSVDRGEEEEARNYLNTKSSLLK